MKTIIISAALLASAILFLETATAQVYDYENDSISKPEQEKVYPAVILSPQDFRPAEKMRYRYDTIPMSRQLRVDSTSTYYRMMERMQRLPGSEQWNNDGIPNPNPRVG